MIEQGSPVTVDYLWDSRYVGQQLADLRRHRLFPAEGCHWADQLNNQHKEHVLSQDQNVRDRSLTLGRRAERMECDGLV